MLAQLSQNLDFSNWRDWIVPAVGVGFGILALLIGRFVFGGRSNRNAAVNQDVGPSDPGRKVTYYSPSEKRKAPRRRGGAVEVFISDAEGKAEPYKGRVLDRSTGGIRLLVDRQIKPGTMLSLRACKALEMVPWVQVQVKSVRQDGKNWELGCQFLLTPPWNVMLLFG